MNKELELILEKFRLEYPGHIHDANPAIALAMVQEAIIRLTKYTSTLESRVEKLEKQKYTSKKKESPNVKNKTN